MGWGGGGGGGEKLKIRLSSAQLQLGFGLSLAISNLETFFIITLGAVGLLCFLEYNIVVVG